jgi:hypothetical protein
MGIQERIEDVDGTKLASITRTGVGVGLNEVADAAAEFFEDGLVVQGSLGRRFE